MAGVIKGYGYVYNNGYDVPIMRTVYGSRPVVPEKEEEIADQLVLPDFGTEEATAAVAAPEAIAGLTAEENTVSAEEARIEREQLTAEFEALRERYESESERFVMRAREKATEIYEETKQMAEKLIADAKAEAEEIKQNAAKEARMKGYEEGSKQGYDDGYVKALKKCKESLVELKDTIESVNSEKADIFMQYERRLFDAVFEIAQKITIDSLKQKDKAVITKMIREAGKKYRKSKNVKIMLSELDIKEEAEIDEELLKDVFRNCERVEIEIIKDAPEGTLVIDDGSEITDAGVMTQLKMIEQLGKGKYRDKASSDIGRKRTGKKAAETENKDEAAGTAETVETVEAAEAEESENETETAVNEPVSVQ